MRPNGVAFAERVSAAFDLGPVLNIRVVGPPGTANRVWRLDATQGAFAVKEFRYTTTDTRWVSAIRRACEFEYTVWRAGRLQLAEPVFDAHGAMLQLLRGPCETEIVVRVHRWLDGTRLSQPVTAQVAAAAGSILAEIQQIGADFDSAAGGSLRWWRWDPLGVVARLQHAGWLDTGVASSCVSALVATLKLLEAGEKTPGPWIFCHYDHKPDNCLRTTTRDVVLLDWDGSARCHPRLEAVESALLWAGMDKGAPNPDLFHAFVEGYRVGCGSIGRLQPSDFAKWIASGVGWFDYLGRRALGEFGDDDEQADAAASAAVAALLDLGSRLDDISVWTGWV